MAITPERFKIKDNETNIATIDFMSIKSSDVLNRASSGLASLSSAAMTIASLAQGNVLKNALTSAATSVVQSTVSAATSAIGGVVNSAVSAVSSTISGLMGSVTSAIGGVVGSVTSGVGGAIGSITSAVSGALGSKTFSLTDVSSRVVGGALSTVNNLLGKSTETLDKLAGPLLEGMPELKSILRSVDPTGYSNILSTALNSPITNTVSTYLDTISNITAPLTTAETYAKLINTLTDGKYSPVLSNDGLVQKVTTAITKEASDLGLTGVFQAFSATNATSPGIVNAANDLITYASTVGNTHLALDIALSDTGPLLSALNPNIAATVASAVNIAKDVSEGEYSALYDRLNTALTQVNSNWNKERMGNGQALSINTLASASSDMIKLIGSRAVSQVPTATTEAQVSTVSDESYLYTALRTGVTTVIDSLKSSFPELPLKVTA